MAGARLVGAPARQTSFSSRSRRRGASRAAAPTSLGRIGRARSRRPEVAPPAVAVGGAGHRRIVDAGAGGGVTGGGAGDEPLLPARRPRRTARHLALAIRRDAAVPGGGVHGVGDAADELPVVLGVRTAAVDARLQRAPRRLAVRLLGADPGRGHGNPSTNEERSDECLAHGELLLRYTGSDRLYFASRGVSNPP